MNIDYYRTQRTGPESAIQSILANNLQSLFPYEGKSSWLAGSVPIGAGIPDLILAVYEPSVFALANSDISTTKILAFLRSVKCARLDTIIQRVQKPKRVIEQEIDKLLTSQIVMCESDVFYISPLWKEILPEIITIEVKVSNWKKAIQQATRNQIFSHRSYIALPYNLAHKIKSNRSFQYSGIGLLSIRDEENIAILKQSRSTRPLVWSYYYRVALYIAHQQEKCNAISSPYIGRKKYLS